LLLPPHAVTAKARPMRRPIPDRMIELCFTIVPLRILDESTTAAGPQLLDIITLY
jgi:hypothetical protein